LTVHDPGELWLQDVTALRAELTSVKERQELLADALEVAQGELERLQACEDAIRDALALLAGIDYDEDSRIDRAVKILESA